MTGGVDRNREPAPEECAAGSRQGFTRPPAALLAPIRLVPLLLVAGLCLLLAFPAAGRQEQDALRGLWEDATTAAAGREWRKAADYFERLHREFGQSAFAEESLWLAAQLRKKVAEREDGSDWERVRDLFHRFRAEYPDSGRGDEAYFEIGFSQFKLRQYREALTHFRLFEQLYPGSPLLPRARYRQAEILLEIGRADEAIPLFTMLAGGPDEEIRLKALYGLRTVYELQGDYPRVSAALERIMAATSADYQLENPELLYLLGVAYLRQGREEEGQKQLWRFVNLAPGLPPWVDALFALGESYYRQGDHAAAQRLYGRVLDEGRAGERAVVLARFRQAQYLDATQQHREQWRRSHDSGDRSGDQPYRAIIEQYGLEPIAQEARYGLFRLLMARNDTEEALALVRGYLRHAPKEEISGVDPEQAGDLLLFLFEELLSRGEYERTYQLYLSEHRHLQQYESGRLRFLAGQALEGLALYEQAAVVYYRAMAGTLSERELAELYYRRALVYFALRDFAAADRLLTHLRWIYSDQPAQLAEAYLLSGRLRDHERRYDEALEFFRRALAGQLAPQRWAEHLPALLRTMEVLELYGEMLEILARGQQEEWLAPELLQSWYCRTGDGLRRRGQAAKARAAYAAALAEKMPQEGENFQAASLHLGSLLAEGDHQARIEAGRYLATVTGPDPLLVKMARLRLNQLDIVAARERVRVLIQ